MGTDGYRPLVALIVQFKRGYGKTLFSVMSATAVYSAKQRLIWNQENIKPRAEQCSVHITNTHNEVTCVIENWTEWLVESKENE